MNPAIDKLREIIKRGDVSTMQARRLALQVAKLIPEGPRRDSLALSLQDALDVLVLCDALNVDAPEIARVRALDALSAIERALAH